MSTIKYISFNAEQNRGNLSGSIIIQTPETNAGASNYQRVTIVGNSTLQFPVITPPGPVRIILKIINGSFTVGLGSGFIIPPSTTFDPPQNQDSRWQFDFDGLGNCYVTSLDFINDPLTLSEALNNGNETDGYDIIIESPSLIRTKDVSLGNADDINLTGGDASGTGNGGNIIINPGIATGSGENGKLIVNGDGYITGDFGIAGKLTVDGLIDPTGLVLTEQSSKPTSGTATTGAIWLHSDGYLVLTDQTDTNYLTPKVIAPFSNFHVPYSNSSGNLTSDAGWLFGRSGATVTNVVGKTDGSDTAASLNVFAVNPAVYLYSGALFSQLDLDGTRLSLESTGVPIQIQSDFGIDLLATDVSINCDVSITGDGYISGNLVVGGNVQATDPTSGAGNITISLAPEAYGAVTALATATSTDVDLTLTQNGFYTFTVTCYVKLATAGTYRKVGAVITARRVAGTLTVEGTQTDLSLGSTTTGITITLSATAGNLRVTVANTTGETVDGRVHAGWEREDLL